MAYDKAILLQPQYALAYRGRGITLHKMMRHADAIQSYDVAIAIEPDDASGYNNRGIVFKDLKRFAEAMEDYDRAISINNRYLEALWNKAIGKLLLGEMDEGWRLYEWRKKLTLINNADLPKPLWDGVESLSGKTILVVWEQGFGDTIQFCRFVPALAELAQKVLFAPHKRLMGLMRDFDENVEIVDRDDPDLRFDFQIPLLSLPRILMRSFNDIPCRRPYLLARPERIHHWREVLGNDGFRIGVCWQGSNGDIDAGRSFPLSQFQPLSELPDVRLISLHKGNGEAQLQGLPGGMEVETLGDLFDEGPDAFLDTAAVMMSCDLVITSDTAVAHLAGALGVTTWVALKYVPDWRWFMDRLDSPWYPSMRVFRQEAVGDWDGVFQRLGTALVAHMEASLSRAP